MDNRKYTCLVVDDEPIARKIVANYIEQLPFLQLGAECINALQAIDHLKTDSNTAIILLDINMPNLSGIQLLKVIQPHQPVIFTTAHTEYAVESYELNAVDYLLKPFSFDRFAKAIYKAIDTFTGSDSKAPIKRDEKTPNPFTKQNGGTLTKNILSRILLKKGTEFHFCRVEEIACFYTESRLVFLVDLNGQKHLTDFKTLNELEDELDQMIFYKVNRQFIVNINAIKKFRQVDRVKLAVELIVKVPGEIIISQGNVPGFKNWIACRNDPAQQ